MLERLIKFIATGFGVGYLPKAPGTFGSVLGAGLWWLMTGMSPGKYWLYEGVAAVLAIYFAGRAAGVMGEDDPPCVVIDEIVALPIVLAGISLIWWQVALGFALFRLFDIWKPFPIRQSQKLPGGLGIVVDDSLAAAYARVGLCAIVAIVGRVP